MHFSTDTQDTRRKYMPLLMKLNGVLLFIKKIMELGGWVSEIRKEKIKILEKIGVGV